jgi:hypothetical protein
MKNQGGMPGKLMLSRNDLRRVGMNKSNTTALRREGLGREKAVYVYRIHD